MSEELPKDAHALEEAEDWAVYWRMRSEEQVGLIGRLKDHAADQEDEIEDLKDELIEAYRYTVRLQALLPRANPVGGG